MDYRLCEHGQIIHRWGCRRLVASGFWFPCTHGHGLAHMSLWSESSRYPMALHRHTGASFQIFGFGIGHGAPSSRSGLCRSYNCPRLWKFWVAWVAQRQHRPQGQWLQWPKLRFSSSHPFRSTACTVQPVRRIIHKKIVISRVEIFRAVESRGVITSYARG